MTDVKTIVAPALPSLLTTCVEKIAALDASKLAESADKVNGLPPQVQQKVYTQLKNNNVFSNDNLKNYLSENLTVLNLARRRPNEVRMMRMLSDSALANVAQCKNLLKLDLSDCLDLTSATAANIVSSCPGLKQVSVAGCSKLDDTFLTALAGCSGLTMVSLRGCQAITNDGLKAFFKAMPNLQSIELSGMYEIDDSVVEVLADSCTKLQNLFLGGLDKLTDKSVVMALSKLPELAFLVLMGLVKITKKTLEKAAEACPKLEILNISYCFALDDDAMSVFEDANNFKSLKQLHLRWNKSITDVGVTALSKGLSNLQVLDLSDMKEVGNASLESLATNKSSLQELYVANNTNVDNSGVTAIAKGCSQLRILGIGGCTNVGDEGVGALVATGSQCMLEVLSLQNLSITNKVITDLAHGAPELRAIVLAGCDSVTADGIKELKEGCKKLSTVYHK